MALIPLDELKLQLTTVQAAIEQITQGKRITRLDVGSGTFKRIYEFQEVDLEHLLALRDELREAIAVQEPEAVTFKTNAHIPMVVGKDIF